MKWRINYCNYTIIHFGTYPEDYPRSCRSSEILGLRFGQTAAARLSLDLLLPAARPLPLRPSPPQQDDGIFGEQIADVPGVPAEAGTAICQQQWHCQRGLGGPSPRKVDPSPAKGPGRCRPLARGHSQVWPQRYASLSHGWNNKMKLTFSICT